MAKLRYFRRRRYLRQRWQAATEFLRGLYEQNLWLRCVVDRVARQAAEMSPNVRLADFCFVTAPQRARIISGLHSAVVFDEFGIACIRACSAPGPWQPSQPRVAGFLLFSVSA